MPGMAAWDLKPETQRSAGCAHENRILKIRQSEALNQCHQRPSYPGKEAEENCKEILQKTKKHLCGDKDDIIYCHDQEMLCCYNNSPCAKDTLKLHLLNDKLRQIKSKKDKGKRKRQKRKEKKRKERERRRSKRKRSSSKDNF